MSTPGTDQPAAAGSPLTGAGRVVSWFLWGTFLLVFYALSPGPLLWLATHGYVPDNYVEAYLAVLSLIYSPLEMIADTPLGRLLIGYFQWCAS